MSDEQTGSVAINTTLAFSDAETIELRTVYLGLSPAIYITPDVDGEDVSFNIHACDLELDDLISVLRLLADNIGASHDVTDD